ncbi:hypothetical protein [Streptomyces atratus]|nr:hypothetical protein [Streptomyces atratus]MCX5345413.1 hypothetical protein [Streptomyces atratus]
MSQRLRRIEALALGLSTPATVLDMGAALMLLDIAEGGRPA